MKFQEKDRVVLRESAHIEINGEDKSGVIGIVLKTFGDLGTVIVAFDGIPVKVPEKILEKYEPESETGTEEKKPVDQITITRDQFFKAVAKVTNPFNLAKSTGDKMSPDTLILLGLTCTIICKEIERDLFDGQSND